MGVHTKEPRDAVIWKTIEKATEQYDQYLELQQVGDLVSVLQAEQDAEPQPPRTDLPLTLAHGH
jgi:hypothetical protein